MSNRLKELLQDCSVEASAPCRIDMGGTLDIPVFYYALHHLSPCTFNAALALRTKVTLCANDSDAVKVSSRGFESAEFELDSAPFDHPLGIIFAIAVYYRAHGIHITVESDSPPKSALGGSSAAALAVIAAFDRAYQELGERALPVRRSVALAHDIESAVLGIPCGLQDQLAAAYGGVNAWYWTVSPDGPRFEKQSLMGKKEAREFEKRILVAYCGIPHVSADVNTTWMKQFVSGSTRDKWVQIAGLTADFVDAVDKKDFPKAIEAMNKEVDLRLEMTPDVLNPIMHRLVQAAKENAAGARFTGAGAGGCVWALGEEDKMEAIKDLWSKILADEEGAHLLDAGVDPDGVLVSQR
ncbi:GHMP kinase [Desulfatibacillum aliphaticivorans]|uniref:GHMP kinase n=1 Tax=Desulfatibacillum aliphaticivorans TaxID=218208 RepID=B8FKE0_DESAL|nr:GHMP kinase [Desulfatibacillum aliphaticivorans]ACL01755.1 GHMP kinase [Desulfatibacillum aliphaticivorans]